MPLVKAGDSSLLGCDKVISAVLYAGNEPVKKSVSKSFFLLGVQL
jgi:hypothetical protein